MSCSYFKKDGTPCNHLALNGRDVCKLHLPQEEARIILLKKLSKTRSGLSPELKTCQKIKISQRITPILPYEDDETSDSTSISSGDEINIQKTNETPRYFYLTCYKCNSEKIHLNRYTNCGHQICFGCNMEETSYASITHNRSKKCPSCELISWNIQNMKAKRRLSTFYDLCAL